MALRNCGVVDPTSIDDYINHAGYQALDKALKMKPEEVIEEIKISGLAGRGGAGFPTWFKWNAARKAEGEQKHLICNADEGDPGAFMDRAVIESDPHTPDRRHAHRRLCHWGQRHVCIYPGGVPSGGGAAESGH